MKILYGVQATGNGHITRARTMAVELKKAGLEVDYLFSGRSCDKFFDMEAFGNYRCLSGLTFITEGGEVQLLKTAFKNNLPGFIRDVFTLKLSSYDLVITDFEPITAWAARMQNKACIGIGHQYAFRYKIPVAGNNPVARLILKSFAPAQRSLGMHWYHFNKPILPPMIEPVNTNAAFTPNKVLVYLPFDEIVDVVNWLRPQQDYEFFIYCDRTQPYDENHIHLRPFSRNGFLSDLATASSVISNAGFELLSESIQFGKKILAKPLKGQMEQMSNARALVELGYGEAFHTFNHEHLQTWLGKAKPLPRPYPNVAETIVNWIKNGMMQDEATLSRMLWTENV